MNNVILSVHQLNDYVRVLLARDPLLQMVKVRGEISNFKHHSSEHMYFSLKDEQDKIQCVLFKQRSSGIRFYPQNGMKVVISGTVSIYKREGQYQLYVEEMTMDGLGDLHLAFERLKKKLREEGLFDDTHKKPLPTLPKKVAVITSPTGAAIKDIIRVVHQRNPYVDILIIPVAVQGNDAANQIAKAIDYANTRKDIDLIITGRGGGSIEELWAFNEEVVARAIFNSRLPVVTAVGHETDYTIADFVADIRAATPSNAAELAVPEADVLQSNINILRKNLIDGINNYLQKKNYELSLLQDSYVFKTPYLFVAQHNQYLDQLFQKLNNAIMYGMKEKKEQLARLAASLQALSPLKVLSRGYVIATPYGQETPISSVNELSPAQNIILKLQDGQVSCTVNEITYQTMKKIDSIY